MLVVGGRRDSFMIMPPRTTTRSTGRSTAAPRGGRTDGDELDGMDRTLVRIEAGLVYVGPRGMAVGLVNRVWPKMGEAGVGWAMVGDCWATSSVRCCWCGNGLVCPIVGVVRVGFRIVGCRSKVSSKKVKTMIPSIRRGISQKMKVVACGLSL
ncbi:hypothetical protein Tco_1187970 [Tanacetum coccineum]